MVPPQTCQILLMKTPLVRIAGQLAGGASSPFYLYRVTNTDSLVGFFANRNHQAAALLALTPFAAHLALRKSGGGRKIGRDLGVVFVFMAVVALGVVRSRTGIILAAPVLACALAVGWRGGGAKADWRLIAGLVGAGLAAAAAVSVFSLTPILDRFAPDAPLEQRFQIWPVIATAAPDYQPTGAGIGSFPRVYASVEPLGLVGPTFLNHAHNEYLEVWLEAGWIGVGLFFAFAIWFVGAVWRARRRTDRNAGLALAAGVAIVSLLAASAVDYPLRTESLAVFAAFCCASLARQ